MDGNGEAGGIAGWVNGDRRGKAVVAGAETLDGSAQVERAKAPR
jgi:hypothetical protein